jgi:hypothetical protein
MSDPNVRVRGNYAYVGFGRGAGWYNYITLGGGYGQYDKSAGNVTIGGTYAYTGHEFVHSPSRTRVQIDPNIRVRGNSTYAGFEDVEGPIALNEMVEVYEAESELVGEGKVIEIDASRSLVYLSVDWTSLTNAAPSSAPANPTSFGGVVYTSNDAEIPGQENWMNLFSAPSLAYVTVSDTALSLTGPAQTAFGTTVLSTGGAWSSSPGLRIMQSPASLWSDWVVAA